MRRLLGVLRGDGDQAPSLAPQPGLAEVPSLVEQVGRAGLRVELVVEGTEAALPPGIDLSAYRIVQEALTNAVKHGGSGPGAGPGPLRRATTWSCEIDERRGAAFGGGCRTPTGRLAGRRPAGSPVGPRPGLVGMRERVNLFGGELRAGPGPGGGFTVAARLPIGTPGP